MIEFLLCIMVSIPIVVLPIFFYNRTRLTMKQAVQQSGHSEAAIRDLIAARLLPYRRKYLVWGPFSLDASRISEAQATLEELQRLQAENKAFLRQQAEAIAAQIRESNRVAQAQLDAQRAEVERLRRLHAEVLQQLRHKALPQRVRQALQVLGLTSDASFEAIHQRYRDLAKRAHPDSGGNHQQFLRLQDAYTCIVNWLESPNSL